MEIAELEAEEARLILDRFGPDEAWKLGEAIVGFAREAGHPVAIDIRTPEQCLFHAALPGATPVNDRWARRKSNTAFCFLVSSMLVTLRARARGRTDLGHHALDAADYALSGGAVPVRVRGAGVVAVATVSGLSEEDDHRLVVRGLELFLQA